MFTSVKISLPEQSAAQRFEQKMPPPKEHTGGFGAICLLLSVSPYEPHFPKRLLCAVHRTLSTLKSWKLFQNIVHFKMFQHRWSTVTVLFPQTQPALAQMKMLQSHNSFSSLKCLNIYHMYTDVYPPVQFQRNCFIILSVPYYLLCFFPLNTQSYALCSFCVLVNSHLHKGNRVFLQQKVSQQLFRQH